MYLVCIYNCTNSFHVKVYYIKTVAVMPFILEVANFSGDACVAGDTTSIEDTSVEEINNVEAGLDATIRGISPKPGSLSVIIGSNKAAVSRRINRELSNTFFKWQPRFYEHIIRNEKSLKTIRKYIRENPMKWNLDEYNS